MTTPPAGTGGTCVHCGVADEHTFTDVTIEGFTRIEHRQSYHIEKDQCINALKAHLAALTAEREQVTEAVDAFRLATTQYQEFDDPSESRALIDRVRQTRAALFALVPVATEGARNG